MASSLEIAERPEFLTSQVQQALARQLRIAPVPKDNEYRRYNVVFPTHETLKQFYTNSGYRLAWSNEFGKMLPRGTIFLNTLRRASEHGLDAENYALVRLEELAAAGGYAFDNTAAARLADFDVLMTAAFFRYASDLSTGRLHPDEIRASWYANPPDVNFLMSLANAIDGDRLAELLERLPPPHPGYVRLQEALRQLRAVEAAGGWRPIPAGPSLELGRRDPRVAILRRRLSEPWPTGGTVTGSTTNDSDRFDEELAGLVRQFQERHGLEPDGNMGDLTLAALNVPIEQRILQIELNLERWRWIPRQLGDRHVFVNIPAFELDLIRDGVSEWRTRVVAGKAFTPTPVLSDRIVSLVVNPFWNVPHSIAVGEYLPELRKDPQALNRRGLRLFAGSAQPRLEIEPTTVNWQEVDEERFPYRIRQDPGPANALGRLKFQLTNDFGIALHDTPAQRPFSRSGRDLSHGCIRVERPLELAMRLLDASLLASLQKALEKPDERHIAVTPPVPVHILYLTARVDEAGVLRFAPDVYEFDAPQRAALDRTAFRAAGK